jgi:hypothetical protein
MSSDLVGLVSTALLVLSLAAVWRVFTKAGESGWKAVIPVYNALVLLDIVARPWWWLLLLLIPIVNVVVLIIVLDDLSESFGHGPFFTAGLLLMGVVFFPILAFDGSRFAGPPDDPWPQRKRTRTVSLLARS